MGTSLRDKVVRVLGVIGGGVAISYVVGCGLLYVYQAELVFPAPTVEKSALHAAAVRAEAVELEIPTADGQTLYGWHQRGTGDRAILYFHGNGSVATSAEYLRKVVPADWHIVSISYRGYPGSTGEPTEEGLRMDARAAWQWVTHELMVAGDRVVLHGRSLGGAVAAGLATEVHPGGLVLESTFLSVEEMAGRSYPWVPTSLLLRHPFHTDRIAPTLAMPTLLMHGDHDPFITVDHGRQLSKLLPMAKYVEAPADSHNTWLSVSVPVATEAYQTYLEARVPQSGQ